MLDEDDKHALYEVISAEVRKTVDSLTANLPWEVDLEIRQRLTEQFRFWSQQ